MKMFNKSKSFMVALSFSAISAATLISSNASADVKSMPGASCSAYNGTNANDISKAQSGAYNRSIDNIWVSCPIIRDLASGGGGASTTKTDVWVYLKIGAAEKVLCRVSSRRADGSSAQLFSREKTGSGWLRIGTITKGTNNGSILAFCRLTPGGRLTTVYWDEK